jgi:hypothetical protein
LTMPPGENRSSAQAEAGGFPHHHRACIDGGRHGNEHPAGAHASRDAIPDACRCPVIQPQDHQTRLVGKSGRLCALARGSAVRGDGAKRLTGSSQLERRSALSAQGESATSLMGMTHRSLAPLNKATSLVDKYFVTNVKCRKLQGSKAIRPTFSMMKFSGA